MAMMSSFEGNFRLTPIEHLQNRISSLSRLLGAEILENLRGRAKLDCYLDRHSNLFLDTTYEKHLFYFIYSFSPLFYRC